MVQHDRQGKSFRERFFNKKAILIILAILVVIGAGAGVGLAKASDNPAFCSTCHLMKPYYESWKSSSLLVNKHAKAGVTCHDCHEASFSTQVEEGVKYITGNYTTPLKKRKFSKELCLKCHNDYQSVIAKTNYEDSNPHDSHYGEQECNLCHRMHQKSTAMCSQCHQFEWISKLDESWAK